MSAAGRQADFEVKENSDDGEVEYFNQNMREDHFDMADVYASQAKERAEN
jgi:hypothetical protein